MTIMELDGGNISPTLAGKDWGYERTIGVTRNVALKRLDLSAHAALSQQVHLEKDEIYYVVQGSGRLELGPNGEVALLLSEGTGAHIPPGVVHRLVANDEGISIIEASTPEITDIVRLSDRYARDVNPDFDARHYWAAIHGRTPTSLAPICPTCAAPIETPYDVPRVGNTGQLD